MSEWVGGRPNLVLAQVQVFGPKSLDLLDLTWTWPGTWPGPDLGPGPELDKKLQNNFIFASLPGEEKSLPPDLHRPQAWGGDILWELPAVHGCHHLMHLSILNNGSCWIFCVFPVRKYSINLKKKSTKIKITCMFLVPPLEKHYPREGGESDPRSRTGNIECPEKQRLDINIRIWENLIVIHIATSEEIEMTDLTPATLAETRDSVNSEVKTVVLWIKSLC